MTHFFDPTVYAIPAMLALILLERWGTLRRGLLGYLREDSLCSLTMGAFYLVVDLATKSAVFLLLAQVAEWSPMRPGVGAWQWALTFVGVDLCFYAFHRFAHEVRFGWAAHVSHHSSLRYNYSTALRQSFVEPVMVPLFFLPLAALGLDAAMILTAFAFNLLYQFWVHTELVGRLGPIGWILNTPSHHRVHHSKNARYLDRNYGGVFIVWDRLFGSFEPEVEAPRYGIMHDLEGFSPVEASLHEWRALGRDLRGARSVREGLGLLLRPPGWRADGAGLTARRIRDEQRESPERQG